MSEEDDVAETVGETVRHKCPVCGKEYIGSSDLDAASSVCFDCIEAMEDDLAGEE